MFDKPIIGIVPDFFHGSINKSSKKDHHTLPCNYVQNISNFGGIAVILPYQYSAIKQYLQLVNAILITGGGHIDSSRYGKIDSTIDVNKERDKFEFSIMEEIIKTKIPIFGICNGMQVINIIYGGSLKHHIPNHEQKYFKHFNNYKTPYHQIKILENTKMHKLSNLEITQTNSSHQMAIDKIGNDLQICAISVEDEIIEAIEHKTHPFCLGVQWHPEFLSSNIDKKIFHEFIKQAKLHQISKYDF